MAKTKLPDLPRNPPPAKKEFNVRDTFLKEGGKEHDLIEDYTVPRINSTIPAGSKLKERNDGFFAIFLPDGSKFFASISPNKLSELKTK